MDTRGHIDSLDRQGLSEQGLLIREFKRTRAVNNLEILLDERAANLLYKG
jgi:hypothetical protein